MWRRVDELEAAGVGGLVLVPQPEEFGVEALGLLLAFGEALLHELLLEACTTEHVKWRARPKPERACHLDQAQAQAQP